ncbi:MAG TPA: CBS domain-containing protein, partial [Steroidobacteraceae bacterium]
VVAGDDEALVGILSSTDVAHASGTRATTVGEVMTPNVLTTTPDAPMESVAALMRERKIGALPVLRAGQLIGLITESDVLRAFTDIFAATGSGARITFDIGAREDILPLVAALVDKHGLRVISLISLPNGTRRYCVLRVDGEAIDALLDDLWKSRHRVESVTR